MCHKNVWKEEAPSKINLEVNFDKLSITCKADKCGLLSLSLSSRLLCLGYMKLMEVGKMCGRNSALEIHLPGKVHCNVHTQSEAGKHGWISAALWA